jgi:hypothetical protein
MLKGALRAVHAAEWRVLQGARSHAIHQKIDAVTSACLARKAHTLLLSAQLYAMRFVHILRTLPEAQRMVAINRLREEQALETQNIEKEEEARLADEKRRAIAPIIAEYKERGGALRRGQRDERIMLMMRLRRTPRQLRLPLRLPYMPRYRVKSFFGQKRSLPPGPEPR